MEGTISLYLENRMKKLGYPNYSFKTVQIVADNTLLEMNAFNEYLYLFDVDNVADNFKIKADNNIITKPDFINVGVPYITHEFTGNIRIDTRSATKPHTFLFYHVIPE